MENKSSGLIGNYKKEIIFVAICLVVFIGAIYKTVISKKQAVVGEPSPVVSEGFNQPEQVGEKEPTLFPTKTPQEIEEIRQIETLAVEVSSTGIEPKTITVKVNDQVQFFNKVDKDQVITVIGQGWGGPLPIRFGENLTQQFPQAGTFPYTVPELNLNGEVVVR